MTKSPESDEPFVTDDLHLAAALDANGIFVEHIEYRHGSNFAMFCYVPTKALEEAVAAYYKKHLMTDASTLFASIFHLKRRITSKE